MLGTEKKKFEEIAYSFSNEVLHLILLPTEKCNFRCTYCYEDYSIGKMSDQVKNGIKNLIKLRAPELKMLSIDWFGGEPLSAKPVLYDIGSYAYDIAKKYQIKFGGGITTNGYNLNTITLRKLFDINVKNFQISLDGPPDIHDKTRIRIDGSGSFNKIWDNLRLMKSFDDDFNVKLRIHITPDNYTEIYRLIDLIRAEFEGDERFKVFLKAISNLGGTNAGTFAIFKDEGKSVIDDLMEYAKGLYPHNVVNSDYVCYAAKPNNYVIRADGTIAKCTVAFSHPANSIGKLREDGTMELDKEKLQFWNKPALELNTKALKCPVKFIATYKNPAITPKNVNSTVNS